MKKVFLLFIIPLLLTGCSQINKTPENVIEIDTYSSGEEKGGIYTIDGNVITAYSGSYIDFDLISQKRFGVSLDVTDFKILSYNQTGEIEYKNNDGIMKKNGDCVFIFKYPEINKLRVVHSGKDDEAEIEVIGKTENSEDYKETYIIKYYCNCE